MHSERVTYLTNAEQKAALEAGNVVRAATARYMAQPPEDESEAEKALQLLVDELEAAIPQWNASFDSMEASIEKARKSIRDALEAVEATK
jgi:tRNA G26 N,N-dimethylase Trm1